MPKVTFAKGEISKATSALFPFLDIDSHQKRANLAQYSIGVGDLRVKPFFDSFMKGHIAFGIFLLACYNKWLSIDLNNLHNSKY